MTNFEKVGLFMKTFGQEVKVKASFSSDKINKLRIDLIEEELEELKEAINKKDLQEAVDKDSGARQAYIANYPYKVEYEQPKLDKEGIVTDPEVKVHYQPWCPLSPEVKIPLNHNMVVTILEPVPSLRDTYIGNVQKMGGSVE